MEEVTWSKAAQEMLKLIQRKKVLIIVTSNDKMGASGKATGFWLEEFAAPYWVFLDAGLGITPPNAAAPNGGAAPIDANRLAAGADNKRYLADATAKAAIANLLLLL